MQKQPFVPLEIREVAVRMLEAGSTYQDTADALGIGVATVNRIWHRFRNCGECGLGPRGGGMRPTISKDQEPEFRQMVNQKSDATYDELTAE